MYINNPGYISKLTVMQIYGKNPSKFFFSGTGQPISTKLGMNQLWLKYYKVYIKLCDDLDLFNGKVKFGNIDLYRGKSENNGSFESYCSLRQLMN